MKEEDIKAILTDFAKRVGYARETLKTDEKVKKMHLKGIFDAKDKALESVEANVKAILDTFVVVETLDKIIHKVDKMADKFTEDELSKYEKD